MLLMFKKASIKMGITLLFCGTVIMVAWSDVRRIGNGKTELCVENVDITKCKVDAIVNAANSQLTSGGGVCGAIFRAAGENRLAAECKNMKRWFPDKTIRVWCPVGEAVITSSYDLLGKVGIRHIVHAVGPDCRYAPYANNPEEAEKALYRAYQSALRVAKGRGDRSIAFPSISSGTYGFEQRRAARVALRAIADYVADNPNDFDKIILANLGGYANNIYKTELNELRTPLKQTNQVLQQPQPVSGHNNKQETEEAKKARIDAEVKKGLKGEDYVKVGAEIERLKKEIEKREIAREKEEKGEISLAKLRWELRVAERDKAVAEINEGKRCDLMDVVDQDIELRTEGRLFCLGAIRNKARLENSKDLRDRFVNTFKMLSEGPIEITADNKISNPAAEKVKPTDGGVPLAGPYGDKKDGKGGNEKGSSTEEEYKNSLKGVEGMNLRLSLVPNLEFFANMIKNIGSDSNGEEIFEGMRRVVLKKGEGLKKWIVWGQGSCGDNSYKQEEEKDEKDTQVAWTGEYRSDKAGGTIGVNRWLGGEEGSGFVLGGFARVVRYHMRQEGLTKFPWQIGSKGIIGFVPYDRDEIEGVEYVAAVLRGVHRYRTGEAMSGVAGLNFGYVTPIFEVMMMVKGDLTKYKIKELAGLIKEIRIDGKGVGGEIEGRWKIKAGERIEIVPKIGIEGTIETYDDNRKNIEKGNYGRCVGKVGVELGIRIGESNKIRLRGVYKLLIKGEAPEVKMGVKTYEKASYDDSSVFERKGIKEGKHTREIGIGWECKASKVVVIFADVKTGIAKRFRDVQAKLGIGFKF